MLSSAAALARSVDDDIATELMETELARSSFGVSEVTVALDDAVDDVMGVNVVLAGKNSVDDRLAFPFPPSVGVFS